MALEYIAPLTCELKILIDTGTDQTAVVTFKGGIFSPPSLDQIRTSCADALRQVRAQGFPNARLLTPDEAIGHLSREACGARVSVAGCPDRWSAFTDAELQAEMDHLDAEEAKEGVEDPMDDED